MKLLCQTRTIRFDIVDLPRTSWRYTPPSKWQVALTVAGIVLTAVLWAVL